MNFTPVYSAMVPAVVITLVAWMNYATRKSVATPENGQYRLRTYGAFNVLGVVFSVLGIAVIVLPLFIGTITAGGYLVAISVGLCIAFAGVMMCLLFRNHNVLFDTYKLEVSSLFGKKTIVEWADIKDINFNPVSYHIVLTDSSGRKTRVYYYMKGITAFIDVLKSKARQKGLLISLP